MLSISNFIVGMLTLYKGSINYVLELLFSLFDFKRVSFISIEDVLFLLNHLPKNNPSCSGDSPPELDLRAAARKLFSEGKFMNHESFIAAASENLEIPELLLSCLLNGAPRILDTCMGLDTDGEHFPVDQLEYRGKKYNFQIRDLSIYYSSNDDITNPKGMILLNDLYVEPSEGNNFILKNGKFFYEFTGSSPAQRDTWVANIRQSTKFREFSSDYTFVQSLGKGAYGDVQLYTKSDGEQVAVKHIRKEPLEAKAEMRIRREVSILKIVNHESIAKLIDYYEKPLELFIVIEYVNGPNLFQWLQSKNFEVPEEAARVIIRKIAQALQYLHGLGIIHRDIKLENIIIDEDNGHIRDVKLIDFGLSCILGPGQTSQEPVGTLKYAAPEVISRVPYRETVDAWGIGVVAYICLIGRMPFFGKTESEIAMRIIKKQLEFDTERWMRVSEDAKIVVSRLLAKKAEERMTILELIDSHWLIEEFDEVPEEDARVQVF